MHVEMWKAICQKNLFRTSGENSSESIDLIA